MRSRRRIFFILIFWAAVYSKVFSEGELLDPQSGLPPAEFQSEVIIQKGRGLITSCHYRAGGNICGKCYCLKPDPESTILFNQRKLRGCARLNISKVGDLTSFVGKTVYYEGSSDFDNTFICPQHFQLFSIRLAEEKPK